MQRSIFSLFIFVAVACAPALAEQPQTSGDPSIDAQWGALEGSRANPVGSEPVDPNRAPATGIFRAFGGRKHSPAQARAIAPPEPEIDPAYLPKVIDYQTTESPGTIVIDPASRYLYLVLEDGKAQRYGVGVGREGFGWSGRVRVGRKAEWPTWIPPAEMKARQPYLPDTVEGGPENPLGARALYLFDGPRDTLFRIHGSNEPWTIGHAVSSGCFRMRNEDVIELYERAGIGTKVVVL
jgi:lipoprotein-anchoring transpeptidase ErfK/SrfK